MKTYFEIFLIMNVMGLGWGLTLNPFPRSYVSLLGVSLLSSCAVLVISWVWALGLGAGGYSANVLILIVTICGWVLGFRRWRARKERMHISRGQVGLMFGLILGVTFIGLGPKIGSHGSIDMALRVGPDAIGNVIGAQALLGNRTIGALENELIVGSESRTIREVLDPPSRQMYELLSFRSQVRGEFIVAGLRWGFSGAAASFASVLGESRLWEIVASLPTIATIASALLMFELLSRRSKKMIPSAVIAFAIIGNMSLLQGWHEGGLAQAFAVSATPIIMLYLWELGDKKNVRVLTVLVLAGAFASYSDLTIVLTVSLLFFLLLQFMTRQQDFRRCCRIFFDLIALPLLVAAPFSTRFITYLPRRLQDSSIGGWSMARWPGVLEILGLFPSFMNNSTGLVRRAELETVFMAIGNAIILGVILKALVNHRRKTNSHVVIGAAIVLFLVFLKSVWYDQSTNYQYIKAIGCLAPLGILALADLLLSLNLKYRVSRALFYVLPATCVLLSFAYVFTYRGNSIRVAASEQNRYLEARHLLNEFVVVAPARYETVLLSPFSKLDWMNRDAGGTKPIYRGSLERPLGVIVLESQCKSWKCLRTIPNSQIQDVSEGIRILKVCSQSQCLFETGASMPIDSIDILNDLLKKWGVNLDQFYVLSRSQDDESKTQ